MYDAAAALLAAGANVNTADADGLTPLHAAIGEEGTEAVVPEYVEYLDEYVAMSGFYPAGMVVLRPEQASEAAVQAVIKAGLADVEARDEWGIDGAPLGGALLRNRCHPRPARGGGERRGEGLIRRHADAHRRAVRASRGRPGHAGSARRGGRRQRGRHFRKDAAGGTPHLQRQWPARRRH